MDTWFADWNNEVEVEIPMPGDHKKPLGVSDGLVELLWENGEVILQSQTHHKPTNDTTKSKKLDQSTSRAIDNSTNSIRDYDETVSWSHCAIDHESFEKQFFANFSNHVEANKLSAQFEDVDFFEFSASDDNQIFPSSQHPDFDPIPLPPPRFETFDSAQKHQKVDKNYCARKVATQSESNEQIITSCGGSDSSLLKTRMHCNDTNRRKRKTRDVEECECQSDATQLESSGHKSSLKSGTSRRSRVPQVHNLSERKRRDRINEKMRALQELIPHSNKSGKASVLDEAIQYMKSLQLQLQFMWIRSGMQQYYTSRLGIGIGPPMLSSFQNLMRPSRLPLVDQAITIPNQATIGENLVSNSVNYQNQTQSPGFREQYTNYMCFPSMQNTSQMCSSYFPFNYPHNN